MKTTKTQEFFQMLAVAVVLLFFVVLLFYLYVRFVRIKNPTARKIEIFGYCMLFTVIIWKFVFEEFVMSQWKNMDIQYVDIKADIAVNMLIELNLKIENMTSNFNKYRDINKSIKVIEGIDVTAGYVNGIKVTEAILQVLSTIFIAIGRIQELRNKRDRKKALPSSSDVISTS